jgi:hypothetical protein
LLVDGVKKGLLHANKDHSDSSLLLLNKRSQMTKHEQVRDAR